MESKSTKLAVDVENLCSSLREKHSPESWEAAKTWFDSKFGNNKTARLKFLDAVTFADSVIVHNEKLGVEAFTMLQGDVVYTSLAKVPDPLFDYRDETFYFYVIVHPSCSIQTGRYQFVMTARLIPIVTDDSTGVLKSKLNECLGFKTTKFFYLPAIEGQPETCVGNLACFQEISYIENGHLQAAKRVGSLSEVGWHLFNAFLVYSFTRPSPDDLIIRADTYPKKLEIGA
jgi:hypothetical protein